MFNKLMMTTGVAAIALSMQVNADPVSETDELNLAQVAMIQEDGPEAYPNHTAQQRTAKDTMLTDDKSVDEAVEDYNDAVKEELDELNEVTSILIDAEELYKDAANLPDGDNVVREKLMELSEERGEQRNELQTYISDRGVEPDTYGEALGTTHRAFTQMRTAFSEDSAVAVEEVLRGENYILSEIDERLNDSEIMSSDAISLLLEIKSDVSASIGELMTLKS